MEDKEKKEMAEAVHLLQKLLFLSPFPPWVICVLWGSVAGVVTETSLWPQDRLEDAGQIVHTGTCSSCAHKLVAALAACSELLANPA